MATLLYKIGRFAARRAWLVILVWLLALGGAVGAYSAFSTPLSTSFTLPGSETQRLQDTLKEKLPEASHGTGQVVLQTADGQEFTQDQKIRAARLFDDVASIDGVASVINPFQTEQSLDDAKEQLEDAQQKLEEGEQKLAEARQKVEKGQEQIEDAQDQIDKARKDLPDDASAEARRQLAERQKKLEERKEELEQAKEQFAPQEQQLQQSRAEYERNLKLWKLSSGANAVSEDGSTAIAMIRFEKPIENVQQETKDAVMEKFQRADLGGVNFFFDMNIAQDLNSLAGPGEIIGVIVALLVLIIMLGTLLAAGLPLISALLGVGIGVLITLSLGQVLDIQQVTPMLGMMLGLAVGIDYSLFILNRHRTNLAQRMPMRESIGLANGTSGNAVVFAGSTVIIALLALNVVGIPFLGVMGTTAALCVLIAVLVATTLTPALLGLLGDRVLDRTTRGVYRGRAGKHAKHRDPGAPRGWSAMVSRRPVAAMLGAVALLLLLAIPFPAMRLGLPDASSEPKDSTQYQAYQIMEEKFGEGANGFVLVVAEMPEGQSQAQAQDRQIAVAEQIQQQDHVTAVVPAGMSEDRTIAVYQVIPEEGPSAKSTEQLVYDLRDLSSQTQEKYQTTLGVTGQTGGNIDISHILAQALPLYIGIVLGLSFIILVLVFRSILVPLTATLGFLFSLLAAFGAVVAVYQWGWLGWLFGVHDPTTVLSFLPTLAVGILFGLAMDYQMFLVSGMREAFVHGADARRSVVLGFNQSAKVVVAAAIIMFSVFGGFVFSEMTMIRPIGFCLGMGVLLDAFVVRMTLIPALLYLLGEKAWWLPSWLKRILPNVDVEGASLERALGEKTTGQGQAAQERSKQSVVGKESAAGQSC